MDLSQSLHQGVGVVGASTSAAARPPPAVAMEKKPPRPQREQPLACPRCNSSNTKFCYYNNYSLAQPRYFCKACKRYWTHGGTLRNVPVGGGSRRSKRAPPPPPPPLLPISAASPPKRVVHFPEPTMQNPGLIHEGFGLVNLSGIFHAGAPWSSFMAVGGGGGGYGHYGGSTTTATMEEGGGGGGFWINGGGS